MIFACLILRKRSHCLFSFFTRYLKILLPQISVCYIYIYIYIYIYVCMYVYIYIYNYRQYCFGLLGLISIFIRKVFKVLVQSVAAILSENPPKRLQMIPLEERAKFRTWNTYSVVFRQSGSSCLNSHRYFTATFGHTALIST